MKWPNILKMKINKNRPKNNLKPIDLSMDMSSGEIKQIDPHDRIYKGAENDYRSRIWITSDRRFLNIENMEKEHILSCIKFLDNGAIDRHPKWIETFEQELYDRELREKNNLKEKIKKL